MWHCFTKQTSATFFICVWRIEGYAYFSYIYKKRLEHCIRAYLLLSLWVQKEKFCSLTLSFSFVFLFSVYSAMSRDLRVCRSTRVNWRVPQGYKQNREELNREAACLSVRKRKFTGNMCRVMTTLYGCDWMASWSNIYARVFMPCWILFPRFLFFFHSSNPFSAYENCSWTLPCRFQSSLA